MACQGGDDVEYHGGAISGQWTESSRNAAGEEAGTTGAPAAILNAVNDALAPLGAMITDQPITAERVVRAVHCGPEVRRWA